MVLDYQIFNIFRMVSILGLNHENDKSFPALLEIEKGHFPVIIPFFFLIWNRSSAFVVWLFSGFSFFSRGQTLEHTFYIDEENFLKTVECLLNSNMMVFQGLSG